MPVIDTEFLRAFSTSVCTKVLAKHAIKYDAGGVAVDQLAHAVVGSVPAGRAKCAADGKHIAML